MPTRVCQQHGRVTQCLVLWKALYVSTATCALRVEGDSIQPSPNYFALYYVLLVCGWVYVQRLLLQNIGLVTLDYEWQLTMIDQQTALSIMSSVIAPDVPGVSSGVTGASGSAVISSSHQQPVAGLGAVLSPAPMVSSLQPADSLQPEGTAADFFAGSHRLLQPFLS